MTELVLAQASAMWRGVRQVDQVWLLVLLIPAMVLLFDTANAAGVLETSVAAFAGTLPYITLAVLLIAYLKATGAEGVIAGAFQGRASRMIVLAALVGGIAPFCSCEVIPFVAALLAAGTPLSAVMAFWLSSPLMDPPQFLITSAALGPEFAVAKVVSAIGIGLAGGFAMKALIAAGGFSDALRSKQGCGSCCAGGSLNDAEAPQWKFWREHARVATFRETGLEQALFLMKWLMLAYLLEGLLIHYVPAALIAGLVGGEGVTPIIIGAFVGAPAYVNGYAAPALVAGLMEQGMSPGAAMSFMVAGAVSCIPAMAAVWALVKRQVFGMYVLFGIGGAVISGLVFAAVLEALN